MDEKMDAVDAVALYNALVQKVGEETTCGTGPVGKFGDGTILKWLVEHKAEIIELLPVIISLFGTK